MTEPAQIRLGTSSFTADGWQGAFYPKGMKAADYLRHYGTRFDTVEIDSSFYACPSVETVRGWAFKTPPGFVFSLKVPRTITHDRVLMNCDAEFVQFTETVQALGNKLGPMVFQFPFFGREVLSSDVEFLSRLKQFFKKLPQDGCMFAVEIRNKFWLKPRLFNLLREHNVALVLQDHSSMPRPEELFEKYDPITADFAYIRWLGDRKGIEALTKVWSQTVIDRTADLQSWVTVCETIQKRGVKQYVYANNHYAGFAPATIEQFRSLCKAKGIQTPLNVQVPVAVEGFLPFEEAEKG